MKIYSAVESKEGHEAGFIDTARLFTTSGAQASSEDRHLVGQMQYWLDSMWLVHREIGRAHV